MAGLKRSDLLLKVKKWIINDKLVWTYKLFKCLDKFIKIHDLLGIKIAKIIIKYHKLSFRMILHIVVKLNFEKKISQEKKLAFLTSNFSAYKSPEVLLTSLHKHSAKSRSWLIS